jgi:hypothetical protein
MMSYPKWRLLASVNTELPNGRAHLTLGKDLCRDGRPLSLADSLMLMLL